MNHYQQDKQIYTYTQIRGIVMFESENGVHEIAKFQSEELAEEYCEMKNEQ